MKKQTLLYVWLLSLTLSGSVYAAYDGEVAGSSQRHSIPVSNDLQADAALARKNKLPILIMFGADDCEYCERLEEAVLNPMVVSGEYNNKIILRKVMVEGYGSLRDFSGVSVKASEFADRYDVKVTPTVVIVDGEGKPLAPKILGLNSIDFYGAYLDQAIDLSYASLRKP